MAAREESWQYVEYGSGGPWDETISAVGKYSLTINLEYLTKNLELTDDLWKNLLQTYVLDRDDRQDIEDSDTDDEKRVSALVLKVTQKSQGHLLGFLRSLEKSGQLRVLISLDLPYKVEASLNISQFCFMKCASCLNEIDQPFSLEGCPHLVCADCADSGHVTCKRRSCQAPRQVKGISPVSTSGLFQILKKPGVSETCSIRCDHCSRVLPPGCVIHQCSEICCQERLCVECFLDHSELQHPVQHLHDLNLCCLHQRCTQAFCHTCRVYACPECLHNRCKDHRTSEGFLEYPQEGQLLSTLPASGDPRTSWDVQDMAWDNKGQLLVAQWLPARVDRLELDEESGKIVSVTNLHTEKHSAVNSISVNDQGAVGIVVCNTGVYFISPEGHKSDLWRPSPHIIQKSCNIVISTDVFCMCSNDPPSTVYVYKLDTKSLVTSIPVGNEKRVNFTTALTRDKIVMSETLTGALYFVDIGTSHVIRIMPRKHFELRQLLHDPEGVSCDSDGRIFVCDRQKNKVHVLSHEGQHLISLMTKGGDLRQPRAIAVRPGAPGQRQLLALSEFESENVQIFTLKKKEGSKINKATLKALIEAASIRGLQPNGRNLTPLEQIKQLKSNLDNLRSDLSMRLTTQATPGSDTCH